MLTDTKRKRLGANLTEPRVRLVGLSSYPMATFASLLLKM
jgi:hypothetical protein